MSDCYTFTEGELPLLISVPHDGRIVPPDIAATMTAAGRGIPDTDWHVARLYEFAQDLGANVLAATHSRYVVDLNRPATDESLYPGQTTTGLCPVQTFAGQEIYIRTAPDDDEKLRRVARYWQPYHDKIVATLDALQRQHGVALLWDAHSIPSTVPRLFDGSLPILNLGSYDGASCAAPIADAVATCMQAGPFESVVNGRFKGGYITRHYGDPANGVHALQMEIAQRAYMDEATLLFDEDAAGALRDTLSRLLLCFTGAARQ